MSIFSCGSFILFLFTIRFTLEGDPFFSKVGLVDLRPKLEIETYEKCDNEGNGEFVFRGRNSRINRTLVVETSKFILHVPLDNRIKVKVRMDLWGNGGWRLNGYIYEMENGCDGMLNILGEEVSKELFSRFSPKLDPKCPLRAGHYTESEFDVSIFNNIKAPGYMVGLWRLHIMFVRKSTDELLGCIRRRMRVSFKQPLRNGTGKSIFDI